MRPRVIDEVRFANGSFGVAWHGWMRTGCGLDAALMRNGCGLDAVMRRLAMRYGHDSGHATGFERRTVRSAR